MGRTRGRPARRIVLLAAMGALLVLMAASPAQARTRSETVDLPQQGSSEWNFRLDDGWNISYTWRVEDGAAVYFDLHTHRGQDVDYLDRRSSARAANGSYVADRRGEYSLFWQASEGAATVTWTVDGRFLTFDEHFDDGEGEPVPGPGGAAAVAGLLAAAGALAWYRRRDRSR